jgi:flagellar hook-associated protein 2
LLVSATGFTGAVATALASTTAIATAKDARIEIGDGVVITRSTNTVDDLYDGVTLTLKQADAAQTITLGVDKDVDDLAAKVKSWVDAVNATLASIDSQSAYDATTKVGGPLMGDSAVRTVRTQLMSALTTTASSGPLRVLSQIGLTIARNGRVQLDEAQLNKAIAEQTDAVAGLLARNATVTSSAAAFVSATEATVAGTYAIDVTTASAPASLSGAAFTALAAAETLTLRVGAASANVTLAAGTTVADAAVALNNALTAARVSAHVAVVAGALRVESQDHGSAAVLGITSSAGAGAETTGLGVTAGVERTATGVDIVGSIGGVAATGAGQLLAASTGAAKGLTVRINAGVTGAAGSITYAPGVMGAVSTLLSASGSASMAISDSINSVNAKKTAYNEQIDRMQLRLTRTEQRLRRQFTQLESALATLRSQGTRLNAIIGSTKNNNDQDA